MTRRLDAQFGNECDRVAVPLGEKGRNVIERYFALAKQWRGIATRYDKLAIT